MLNSFFKKSLFCLLFFLSLYACTIKRQKETVATYLGHDINGIYGHGGSDTWEYSINGKSYRTDAFAGELVGARYILIYDSLHPDKNKVLSSRPIFIGNTGTAIGIITKSHLSISKKWAYITYKYQVANVWDMWYKNETFEKLSLHDTLIPKVNDTYEVEYYYVKPSYSIFHSDRQIVMKETYCTMKQSKWEFYDNKKHCIVQGPQRIIGGTEGTKYKLTYDSLNPQHYFIYEDQPLFLETEQANKTKGTITKIDSKEKIIYYEYEANNTKLYGVRFVKTTKNLHLKLKQQCEVTYWIENPHRSIINLGVK